MFHNQVQQVQQKISSVQQMVAQIRQSEQNNQQRLQQIAQDEAYASQQLQRVQQICQEVVSNLQNASYAQTAFTGAGQYQTYQTAGVSPAGIAHGTFAPTSISPASMAQYGSTIPTQNLQGAGAFDPSTMSAETYQGTMQTFGNVPGFGSVQTGFRQPAQQFGTYTGQTYQGTAGLSNIATMSPDTYLASQQHLGKGQASMSQIGQQAGISGAGVSAAGMTAAGVGGMGTSTLSNIATMGPDTFEASQQRLGGVTPNLSQIGQQAGISTAARGYNQ